MTTPCPACELVAGRRAPPGGVLARADGIVVHAVDAPTPVAGWVVLTPEVHVRAVHDLDAATHARLFAWAHRVARAQRDALGAAHGYVVVFGEVLLHAHVHVIPRYADTPDRLRGPRVFQAGPDDARPLAEVEAAARTLRAALAPA
ncbi:MAG: HIT family protein [Planctomycetia bacterium]|nr:HIT family protein [Planctomycetia bacterium]